MEILLLSDKSPWPPDSGGSIALMGMIRELAGKGLTTTLLAYKTPKHPSSYKEIPENLQTKVNINLIEVKQRRNPLYTFWNLLFSKKPYNIYRYNTSSFEARLIEILASGKFDIIQFEGIQVGRFAKLVRSRSDAKLVYRAHNVEYLLWQERASIKKSFIRRSYYRIMSDRLKTFETELIYECNGLMPISEEDKRQFESLESGVSSVVVYPTFERMSSDSVTGVQSDLIADSQSYIATKERNILFLGSLDWGPNIDGLKWLLTDVLPLVKESDPTIKLIVAGRRAGEKLIRLINNSNAVYAGSPADSVSFLRSGCLMVAPLWASSGIRIKIIEALMLGLPVVTTTSGAKGFPKEVKMLIDIEDTASLFAKGIIDSINNERPAIPHLPESQRVINSFFGNLAYCEVIAGFYSKILNDN